MEVPTITNTTDKQIKFSVDEVKEISDIRDGFDKAAVAFGKFYLQKRELEKYELQLRSELELLERQEKEFLDKIMAKYGEGTYDPKTEIFIPKKK